MKTSSSKLDPLVNALVARRVVPFVGTGFSVKFGYPTWNDLLGFIINKLEIQVNRKDITSRDPLQVAEALWLVYKEKYYHEVEQEIIAKKAISRIEDFKDYIQRETLIALEEKFNNLVCQCMVENLSPKRDNSVTGRMKLFSDLDFRTVVTTNYDDVLETRIFDKGISVIYPGSGRELEYDDSKPCLYKIHGDIKAPGSIILTHSQYYYFMHQLGFFKSKLYTVFAGNVILMLGYSFRDINIHDVYFQYRKDYKDFIEKNEQEPRVYLVLTKYDHKPDDSYYDLHKKFLKGAGIEVIDEFDELHEFIEALHKKFKDLKEAKGQQAQKPLSYSKDLAREILKIIYYQEYNIEPQHLSGFYEYVHDIFENPMVLLNLDKKLQLNYDGSMPESIGMALLDAVIRESKKSPGSRELATYAKVIYSALKFADEVRNYLNNFYFHPQRFDKFIQLSINVEEFALPEKLQEPFAELFSETLDYSGFELGKCFKSGKILETHILQLPIEMFHIYVDEMLRRINASEPWYVISDNELHWLKLLQEITQLPFELAEKIDRLVEEVEKLRKVFF